ncbi:hypothetical protein RV15_GL002749 [Enterococcus silesiacus]|nr:ATP-grasp domain-containing protein [Enterococcus silesiacus]OJG92804.1 hypothetical protein RV15_GL002749 [Enterococcus silesiacus]
MNNNELLFKNIFDTEDIYNPRVSFDDYGYLPKDTQIFDIITGREFAIMPNLPIICSKNVNQKDALELLQSTGLSIPKKIYRYNNKKDYHRLLNKCASMKKTIIMQYPHKQERLNSLSYNVPPNVTLDLSNKATITKLVNSSNVVPRTIIDYNTLKSMSFKNPIVIKNGDGSPTAGGYGVYICMNEEDLSKAIPFFAESHQVILETYIHPEENLCIQFSCNKSGHIRFLGATKQLISAGIHKGNVIGNSVQVDSAIVTEGTSIMQKAHKQGFYGIAGFDVIIAKDQFYFIDLNFRLNASTAPLLLMPFLSKKYSKENGQLGTFCFEFTYEKMLDSLYKLMHANVFFPLSIWNPKDYCIKTPPSVIGLTFFNTDSELLTNLTEMSRLGFKKL